MGYIDYTKETCRDIAFIDMKSFYASVECVKRGLNPLETSLCVMSGADNSSGLILAASPMFKKVFGKNNVGRKKDLPFDIHTRKFKHQLGCKNTFEYRQYIECWAQKTLIVASRMSLYIQENIKIQKILLRYTDQHNIHPYSIDESLIDLTHSLNYFFPNQTMTRKEKLALLCIKIQKAIYQETGIYASVGMSNANPLLAKLALDNEVKKHVALRANWSYEDVETKVLGISNLTDFWGIGENTKRRLAQLHIFSIRQLANYNLDILKTKLGVIGVQLWFHANGVDESKPSQPYHPVRKGLGNSQVLPRDYTIQSEIEVVLSELAEQVAIRLRKTNKKTSVISLYIGFSYLENKRAIHVSTKIIPTNYTKTLIQHVLTLFRKKYVNGAVRNIAVCYDHLINDQFEMISLFDTPEHVYQEKQLDTTIDTIRNKFGALALQNATSLLKTSRVKTRSKLIGGHDGGES